jgi:hypothetical protein
VDGDGRVQLMLTGSLPPVTVGEDAKCTSADPPVIPFRVMSAGQ